MLHLKTESVESRFNLGVWRHSFVMMTQTITIALTLSVAVLRLILPSVILSLGASDLYDWCESIKSFIIVCFTSRSMQETRVISDGDCLVAGYRPYSPKTLQHAPDLALPEIIRTFTVWSVSDKFLSNFDKLLRWDCDYISNVSIANCSSSRRVLASLDKFL